MTAISSEAYSAMHLAHERGLRAGSTGNRAFPVQSLNDWQVKALQKLAGFGRLNANWDSYGSPAIPDPVLAAAMDLIANITFDSTARFRLTPISGGGVQLEWAKGDRELQIEIGPDLTYEILIDNGEEPLSKLFRSVSASFVESLLSWTNAG